MTNVTDTNDASMTDRSDASVASAANHDDSRDESHDSADHREAIQATHSYSVTALKDWAKRLYRAYGFTDEDSSRIVDSLMFAELHGIDSHGLQRVGMYDRLITNPDGGVNVNAHAEIVQQTPVSAVIDGRHAMGQLTSDMAMELAIKKARTSGIGIVTVRESNHFGAAGYYTNMAAEKGLLGFASTNTGPIVLPTYAIHPFLGTNPIAFSMPAEPHPFFFDAATSIVSHGKIEVCEKEHRQLPEAWMVDDRYEPIWDPKRVPARPGLDVDGGMLPVGGLSELTGSHKGYGFSMLAEIFCGILPQGNVSSEVDGLGVRHGVGHCFAAIDPAIFGDPDAIIARFSEYLEQIRRIPAAPGRRVYVHGDKEEAAYQQHARTGLVGLDTETVDSLRTVSDRLGVSHSGLF
ncbi:Ldh family oxidoreductase [Bifidobacterium callimiconis]|uniref:Ldh family oxidoreductase n=1 Tax=Bifidobacterium callimiconis TaxID=2306973 RepID=UPI001BDD3A9F|nr:Ldh family oxidoreductase [Bifidobacterium callimiconis]MBT1176252.1 Ldh family oxidoreductase [Bifidobacterium callimiconis]